MKICTIGLGYIGLPTAVMFAKHGLEVVGVDVKEQVVNDLNNGIAHIEEPGLNSALSEVVNNGNFRASCAPETADTYIIAVPTPNNDDLHKSCDLTYVKDAIRNVLLYIQKGNTIIVESTIAPRSMDDHIKPLIEREGLIVGEDVFLVHCPERVLPGKIMEELVYNNRIVGGMTDKCTEAGAKVYSEFVEGEIIKTNGKTAEMSKLMENTFRDVNIALANEMTKVCNELQINAYEVIEMANKHPRVNIHTPGPGVGGHCLAVDPYFIISKAVNTTKLISTAREVNNSMPLYIKENVDKLLNYNNGGVVTVFGLTYKGNVDDVRESPAMEIYNMLKLQGDLDVRAYDPHVKNSFVENNIKRALKDSELILVLTDHDEFKEITEDQLSEMSNKIMLDTKNIVKEFPSTLEYFNLGNIHNKIVDPLTSI